MTQRRQSGVFESGFLLAELAAGFFYKPSRFAPFVEGDYRRVIQSRGNYECIFPMRNCAYDDEGCFAFLGGWIQEGLRRFLASDLFY